MSKTYLLFRIQIINYLALNEMKQSGQKKKTAITLAFGVVTLLFLLCTYNWFTALALVELGKQDFIPAYMVSVSSFAILFLTALRSNGILYGSHDLDLLLAAPIKHSEIISSKFLFMYVLNFLVAFAFMTSGGVVWMLHTPFDIFPFTLYVISLFFVPFIPMCIASLLGLCMVYIGSFFKNRNIFAVLFSFISLGLIVYVANVNMHSGEGITNIGVMLANQITKLYPPAVFFLDHSSISAPIRLASFIGISTVVFYLFIKFVSAQFRSLNDIASTSSKYRSNEKKVLKHRSPFVALYRKEVSQFFHSYTAVLNAGLGVILLSVFSIFLIFASPEQLGKYIRMDNIHHFLSIYGPIIISAMLSLSCPAAFAISLEGRNIWIVQSSPVSIKKILNSKLAMNLTLHAIAYCLAILAFTTRVQMDTLQIISTLLIPIAFSLFSITLGLFVNKKYPNFTWDNEMIIVKQSLPVIITSLISMLTVVGPIMLHWILPFPLQPLLWGIAVVMIVASAIMYQKACKATYI
ncbi:hypothetical protein [Virgibacillus sp. Bac330]|uniref:putative ABC transporter permease subunit n=1 Tax=Virgibacillus sp. Bac330 TaxID=2419841 RepID=UPI000EF49B46|nr:hypothetical protein [Virgibacillus sp. Bac330]